MLRATGHARVVTPLYASLRYEVTKSRRTTLNNYKAARHLVKATTRPVDRIFMSNVARAIDMTARSIERVEFIGLKRMRVTSYAIFTATVCIL